MTKEREELEVKVDQFVSELDAVSQYDHKSMMNSVIMLHQLKGKNIDLRTLIKPED